MFAGIVAQRAKLLLSARESSNVFNGWPIVVSCPLGQDYKLARWKWKCDRVVSRRLGLQGRDGVGKRMSRWSIRVFVVVEVLASIRSEIFGKWRFVYLVDF